MSARCVAFHGDGSPLRDQAGAVGEKGARDRHRGCSCIMTADDLTRPERAAQIRQAKRYRALIDRVGLCRACKHRDRHRTFWGRSMCRIGDHRQHPACERDGQVLRFEFDDSVLNSLREGGNHG